MKPKRISGMRWWYRTFGNLTLTHRSNGPAIEYETGQKQWFSRGIMFAYELEADEAREYNRTDCLKPYDVSWIHKMAIVRRKPTREPTGFISARRWKIKTGFIHRVGGPAIEYDDGSKYWVFFDRTWASESGGRRRETWDR